MLKIPQNNIINFVNYIFLINIIYIKFVDLKQIDNQIFLQQNEFIREQKRISIWKSNNKPCASPENKGGKWLFYKF